MKPVSNKTDERARKIETLILQRLADKGQVTVAHELSVSESTISRWKSDDLEKTAKLIAALNLKIVPETSLEVSQNELLSLKTLARKYLEIDEMA